MEYVEEGAERRRLAGAVSTDQGAYRAARHRERDLVECADVAVQLGELAGLDREFRRQARRFLGDERSCASIGERRFAHPANFIRLESHFPELGDGLLHQLIGSSVARERHRPLVARHDEHSGPVLDLDDSLRGKFVIRLRDRVDVDDQTNSDLPERGQLFPALQRTGFDGVADASSMSWT